MSFIETKSRGYVILSGQIEEVFDIYRNLPYKDLSVTVEPMKECIYSVDFYMGEDLVDSVSRSEDRLIERYVFSGLYPPTNPNCNWVEQERGEYVPGNRASVKIENLSSESIVFVATFSAIVSSHVFH